MADPLAHGEETFHFLLSPERFVLIGPFVSGGLAAMAAVREACPDIPCEDRYVGRVPYRYREPGWFGLRLFPVPGLRTGPLQDLDLFELSETGEKNV